MTKISIKNTKLIKMANNKNKMRQMTMMSLTLAVPRWISSRREPERS